MKTSELQKIVEDNGCYIENLEYNKCLNIHFNNNRQYKNNLVACVDKSSNYTVINSICPKVIAQAILDYAYTPLEEREEEKKYRLRLPNGFNNLLGENYVCLANQKDNRYVISSKDIAYISVFTQKEIDEMPFDTKFFEKVLVE